MVPSDPENSTSDAARPVASAMRQKLTAALAPTHLEIKDESALHAGHAGAPGHGESHFRLLIVSDAFAGLSRVARQRRVNDILKAELAGPVHALSMQVVTPDEYTKATTVN